MSRKIQHKRGLKKNLPILADAEFAITTDTEELFVGLGGTNFQVGQANLYLKDLIPNLYALDLNGLTLGNINLPKYNVILGNVTLA